MTAARNTTPAAIATLRKGSARMPPPLMPASVVGAITSLGVSTSPSFLSQHL